MNPNEEADRAVRTWNLFVEENRKKSWYLDASLSIGSAEKWRWKMIVRARELPPDAPAEVDGLPVRWLVR